MSVYLGSNKIGDSIFKNNAKMGKLVEGSLDEITSQDFDGVYFVYDYKFAYSNGLKKVTFHNDVYEIGKQAFEECANLEEILNFCGSKIDDNGFYYCYKLKNVEVKDIHVTLGNYVFRGCALEDGVVENILNNCVFSMGENCFMQCNNLKKLNLEFYQAPSNAYINYFENNTQYMISGFELPKRTFYNCANLEEVTLSEKIIKIGDGAFDECAKLKKITIKSPYPPETKGFISNVYNHPIEVIYIPKGSIHRYRESYPFWSNFSDIFVEME